jgi:hypothetical protein
MPFPIKPYLSVIASFLVKPDRSPVEHTTPSCQTFFYRVDLFFVEQASTIVDGGVMGLASRIRCADTKMIDDQSPFALLVARIPRDLGERRERKKRRCVVTS